MFYDFTVDVVPQLRHGWDRPSQHRQNALGDGHRLSPCPAIAQERVATTASSGASCCAPDHLLAKWEREIKETIPGALVYRFDDWRGIVRLLGKGRKGRWPKPQGPEYYIVGRNQAKWYPDWLGTSDPYRGFGGRMVRTPLSSRNIIVDRVPVVDEKGKQVRTGNGEVKTRSVTSRLFACPRCGAVIRDRKGSAGVCQVTVGEETQL